MGLTGPMGPMGLIGLGICIMLAGLGLHLAMVAQVLGPGLLLSLIGYAALFTGMFITVAGITRIPRRRR